VACLYRRTNIMVTACCWYSIDDKIRNRVSQHNGDEESFRWLKMNS
jgi:hypothetical protein